MMEPLNISELGARIRDLRLGRGLSLREVSERASVSVSMVSAVERGDKVASIQVLHQIATALHSSVARLLESEALPRAELLRREEQVVIDSGAGWARHILSPDQTRNDLEFNRIRIEPGVEIDDFGPHKTESRGFLAVEQGMLTVILDSRVFQLDAGDSLCFAADCRQVYRNDGHTASIHYLAMRLAVP